MKCVQKWSYLLLLLVFCFSACQEVGPYINFEEEIGNPEPSVDSTNAKKVILLEEFTGVRCPNCPAGSVLAEQLANQYSGQVIIVSIHSGFFSIPYPNAENFKIEAGAQIENLLEKATAYPSAAINRKLFENESRRIVSSPQWNNYIQKELNEPVSVSIQLNITKYEPGNIAFNTFLEFLGKIETTVKLTVLLIEDNIVSPQDVDGIKVDDYIHKHVLRAVLTPYNGVVLDVVAEKGKIVQNDFAFNNFETHWNENNMHIVAFVHGSGSNLNVLNATQVPLIE